MWRYLRDVIDVKSDLVTCYYVTSTTRVGRELFNTFCVRFRVRILVLRIRSHVRTVVMYNRLTFNKQPSLSFICVREVQKRILEEKGAYQCNDMKR